MVNEVITVLAQSPISTLIGTGVVGGAITVLVIKHMSNRNIHMNGKEYADENVCTERHKNLDKTLARIEKSITNIYDKLDAFIDSHGN